MSKSLEKLMNESATNTNKIVKKLAENIKLKNDGKFNDDEAEQAIVAAFGATTKMQDYIKEIIGMVKQKIEENKKKKVEITPVSRSETEGGGAAVTAGTAESAAAAVAAAGNNSSREEGSGDGGGVASPVSGPGGGNAPVSGPVSGPGGGNAPGSRVTFGGAAAAALALSKKSDLPPLKPGK